MPKEDNGKAPGRDSLLGTASPARKARLPVVGSAKILIKSISHAAPIRALEVIDEGRRIRSLESTGTIRMFPWRQRDLMSRACEVAPRKAFDQDRWKTWVPGEPYRSTCDAHVPARFGSR